MEDTTAREYVDNLISEMKDICLASTFTRVEDNIVDFIDEPYHKIPEKARKFMIDYLISDGDDFDMRLEDEAFVEKLVTLFEEEW